MAGEGKLFVLKTQWFDFIYSKKTKSSAEKIARVADEMYAELCSKLGFEMTDRFPVSVTSSVESLNAFFSLAPYNLIVVYDTPPSESLDMHEDTLLAVFYHELTHAVTLNAKSPFWRAMAHFADVLTPAGISLTSFWFEGAAVSLESRDSAGGRLFDPFFTQLVTKAKLDDILKIRAFPSWRDVTGARDIFPGGQDAYAFGALFAEFLQEKYGIKKYGEFWNLAGTKTRLVPSIFKTCYGTSLSDEWQAFYDWIEIPSSALSVKDFGKIEYISKENAFVRAFDVFENEDGFFVVFFDSLSSGVFLSEFFQNGKIKKTRRLFSATGVNRLVFSSDGKKIAVTRTHEKRTTKSEVAEYDILSGAYHVIQSEGATSAFFEIENVSFLKIDSAHFDEIIFSPVFDETSSSKAFVSKKGLSWCVKIESGGKTFSVDFGKKIVHDLHVFSRNDGKLWLSFSWAELGKKRTFSRAGFLLFDETSKSATVFFQAQDGRAGILGARPVFLSDGSIFLVSLTEEFDRHPISLQPLPRMVCENFPVLEEKIEEIEKSEENEDFFDASEDFEEKPYHSIFYYKNGAKFPISILVRKNFSFEETGDIAFLGGTFLSANPWTDCIFMFSSGVNPFDFFGGSSARLSGGDGVFSYSAQGTVLFTKNGFQQTSSEVSLSLIPVRFLSGFVSLSFLSDFFYGEEPKDADTHFSRRGLHAFSTMSATFSTVHRENPKTFWYSGFLLKPFVYAEKKDYDWLLNGDLYRPDIEKKAINAGGTAQVRVPILFPFTITASLYPELDTLLKARVSAVVFNREIQKGIPALSVFVRRFYVTISYSGKIKCESERELFDIARIPSLVQNIQKDDYSDVATVLFSFDIAPNTGYAAQSLSFSVSAFATFRPHPSEQEKSWKIGATASVNF